MRLYVVPGKVPLLVSKASLKAIGGTLDLTKDILSFGKAGTTALLSEGPTGHYQLNLLDDVVTTPEDVEAHARKCSKKCGVEEMQVFFAEPDDIISASEGFR